MSYPTWGGMDHIARGREEKVKSGVSWYRKRKEEDPDGKKKGFFKKCFQRKKKMGGEE